MRHPLILLMLFLLLPGKTRAQLEKTEDRNTVIAFIQCFKPLNKEKLVDKVAYPLQRDYPLPPIRNRNEMLDRFDEVFDAELIAMITGSDLSRDWSTAGWRGMMLQQGELWLDYDGSLIAVNHSSSAERAKRQSLLASDRASIHPSLRKFKEPVLLATTTGFRIRIDQMEDESYRYACWKATAEPAAAPDLVLGKGEIKSDGSGGNHEYTFVNGQYSYTCSIEELGDGGAPGELIVRKNGREVLVQEFTSLHK